MADIANPSAESGEFWLGKKVLVTGGDGFLGKSLVPLLRARGVDVIIVKIEDYDLTQELDVERLFSTERPQLVIHLAADVGGIDYVSKNCASVFYNNVMMNTLLIEHAHKSGVEKMLVVSTSACYPESARAPLREADIWNGLSEPAMRGYGMSKRMMLLQSELYYRQYGFLTVNLVLDSLYGPHDVFTDGKTRVIPANIKHCIDAQERGLPSITAWGSGAAVRDFIFVEDAAQAIIIAMETVVDSRPINVGAGRPLSIKQLIESIAAAVGYTGRIEWDATKPGGQQERHLDTTAAKALGILPKTSIEEGLARTVAWYRSQRPISIAPIVQE